MDNSSPPTSNAQDSRPLWVDFLKLVRDDRGRVLKNAAIVTVGAAIIGALYLLFGQPVRTVASVEFRPVFSGAEGGRYPNGLPFGPGDITAAGVVDQVYDKGHLQDYCDRTAFRAGFVAELRSPELTFLIADYQARLADSRLTTIERGRLQADYDLRRQALPLSYLLSFDQPASCRSMPSKILSRLVNDVVATWANDAESRRGVLKFNVKILSQSALDTSGNLDTSLLIRADILHSTLQRLSANISDVQKIQGAELIRLGDTKVTFDEVRGKVESLIQSSLDPLVVSAGRSLGADSLVWVDEALASAERDRALAAGQAKAYLDALQEYSGVKSSPSPLAKSDTRQATPGTSDVQTLTPVIDRTFIDRLLEMSAPNLAFRQELTRSMVEASVEAVRLDGKANHYRHLSQVLHAPGTAGLTREDVTKRLESIATEGKSLAKQFEDLCDEMSRTALRPGPSLYQLSSGARVDTLRAFSLRDYAMGLVVTFLATLVLVAFWMLVSRRLSVMSADAS